jgi:hypothetical protein
VGLLVRLVGMVWAGSQVRRARALWAARLPAPCYRCGLLVTAADSWDVEHDPPRSAGGSVVVGVSHSSCNRAHGARLINAARSRPLGVPSRRWLSYFLKPGSPDSAPGRYLSWKGRYAARTLQKQTKTVIGYV